jgi:DNA-binding NarL/FixJ family response regulator
MPRIRVVVISPFRLYRDALAALLRGEQQFEIAAALAGVSELRPSANGAQLDAVLLDARLIMNKTAVSELRSSFPGARIVAISVSGKDREAVRCARAGVDGIVGHDAHAPEIASVLGQIRRGEFSGSGPVAAALFKYLAWEV